MEPKKNLTMEAIKFVFHIYVSNLIKAVCDTVGRATKMEAIFISLIQSSLKLRDNNCKKCRVTEK